MITGLNLKTRWDMIKKLKESVCLFYDEYIGWDGADWFFFMFITFPLYFLLIQWMLRK